jgi:hypothetical protein
MPTRSFCWLGGLGAGENRSCTLSEGFGCTFVEPTEGWKGAVFPVNFDFSWCLFASSSSSAGNVGYSRPSEGAR